MTNITPRDAPASRSSSSASIPPAQESASAAAARWMREHADVLWRFCMSRTGSIEVSEEVVQETLVAAMQAHASFAGRSSERTWLLSIASHKIADHFRKVRRRGGTGSHAGSTCEDGACPAPSMDSLFDEAGRWRIVPAAWTLARESTSEHASQLRALRACIDGLPPEQAEPIWLRELLGVPPDQVCKDLGLTPTNLWTRLHRARHALRQCLDRSLGSVEKLGKERGA